MKKLLAFTLVLAACSNPNEPEEMTPAPPVIEELRPQFENACGFEHNSGPECQRLMSQAAAAAAGAIKLCASRQWGMCSVGAWTAVTAINEWAQGVDSYGHRDWSECNWCSDPVGLNRPEDHSWNANREGAK